ncbi:MAG: hypothetical protein R3F14_05485 [Polyangiaceae bacterium]
MPRADEEAHLPDLPLNTPAPGHPSSASPSAAGSSSAASSPGTASSPGAASATAPDVDGALAAFAAAGTGAAPTAPDSPRPRTPRRHEDDLSPRAGGVAWPGIAAPAPEKRPLDPRILIGAGAGVLLLAVGIAFFAGRASGAPESGDTADTTSPPVSKDRVALAQHVATALTQSLQRVAHSCKIDVASLRGRPLFEVAYRRCGPPTPTVVQLPPPDPTLDPDPVPDSNPDIPPDDPAPQKPRPSGNSKLQKVDTPSGSGPSSGSICLSGCTRSHRSCTAACGAEPKQGSQYDAYQSCLGGCLKSLSQCKLGCN